MDRRTLLALILCLLIPIGWQKLLTVYYPNAASTASAPSAQTQGQAPERPFSQGSVPAAQLQQGHKNTPRAEQKLALRTGTGDAVIGDAHYFFVGWKLKSYKLGMSPEAAAVDLPSVVQQEGAMSLAFENPQLAYLNDVQGDLIQTPNGPVWSYEDSNIKLSREFSSSENQPYVDLQIKAEFKTIRPKFAFVTLGSKSHDKDPEAQDRQLLYWTDNSLDRIPLKDDVQLKEVPTSIKYVGATNRYFLFAAVAQGGFLPNGLIQPGGASSAKMNLVYPLTGNTMELPLRVYFGPKELDILRKVEPTLDHTVDFGWFTLFAYPLLTLMKWIYQYIHNYGVAIILLTLLLKVATFPLTYKSMKNMKRMAKFQPQMQKLRDKYKDDKEALNREMLTLMKTQGYNPMAGCLPLLIQMPIFFALYRVLYSSIELYHAPFAIWIKDLSSHDPFYVTPVLLTATMFIQQKMTPNTAQDPAQAKMLQFMPIIFGAFMIALPSGLTLYMLTNALAGIAQQMILNRKLTEANAT